MPIIHNESFSESDPFQLRRFGCYNMEGGPDVVVEEFLASRPAASLEVLGEVVAHAISQDPELFAAAMSLIEEPPPGKPELEIARFVAYWTPERRAQRVTEELQS